MNLTPSKRMTLVLVAALAATTGCGGGSSKEQGGSGAGGLLVTVTLPSGLQDGGPAGFGRAVSGITATVTADGKVVTPDSITWSIGSWDGVSEPPTPVTPSPTTGDTTSFEIPAFEDVRQGANVWLQQRYGRTGSDKFDYVQAPEREQLLSFGAQQVRALSYLVVATVQVGGSTATGSALVSPVTVSSGGQVQPKGMMIVANAKSDDTYAWKLEYLPTGAAAGAAWGDPPSGVTLEGVDTKNPYLVPTVTGLYRITNGTHDPLMFRVSTYHGAGTSDSDPGTDGVACNGCHNTEHGDHTLHQFDAWSKSAHADINRGDGGTPMSLFESGVRGLQVGYEESCMSCHVVGYSKVPTTLSAAAGTDGDRGFADVAAHPAAGAAWTFPALLGDDAWATVATNAGLKHRVGVQCESCHGPLEPTDHSMVAAVGYGSAAAPKASMDSGICLSCHDGERYDQGPLWTSSPHADVQLAMDDASVESRGTGANHCGRCHSGEGFVLYLAQQQKETGNTPGNLVRPTTCSQGQPFCDCTTTPGTCVPMAAATCTPREGYRGATDPTDPQCPCKPTAPATTCSGDSFFGSYLATTHRMSKATIHSVTCQTCHDPHTGGLRVEGDTFQTAALFRVQNAGAGALCIVCHNTRSNQVRQGTAVLKNSSGGNDWAAPHTAAQGDVFAGRNAFFISDMDQTVTGASLPHASPHLGAGDSCVLCHLKTVAADVRDQYHVAGVNHSFKTSPEVCAECHSDADAAGFKTLQEETETRITDLGTAIVSYLMGKLNASGFDAADRFAPTAEQASLPAPTTPTIAAGKVTAVSLVEYHGSPAVVLTLSSDTGIAPFGIALNKLYAAGTATTPKTPIFDMSSANNQNLARIVYNYMLLEHDGSGGLHNPPFVDAVLTGTTTALGALP